MSEMALAPPGAPLAPCAVCGFTTDWRIREGDGHVPICKADCEGKWVHGRPLREVAKAAMSVYRAWDRDLHYVNKMFALGCALRDAGFDLKSGSQSNGEGEGG